MLLTPVLCIQPCSLPMNSLRILERWHHFQSKIFKIQIHHLPSDCSVCTNSLVLSVVSYSLPLNATVSYNWQRQLLYFPGSMRNHQLEKKYLALMFPSCNLSPSPLPFHSHHHHIRDVRISHLVYCKNLLTNQLSSRLLPFGCPFIPIKIKLLHTRSLYHRPELKGKGSGITI